MTCREVREKIMDSELFYWTKTLAVMALFVWACTATYKSCHPEVIVPGQHNFTPVVPPKQDSSTAIPTPCENRLHLLEHQNKMYKRKVDSLKHVLEQRTCVANTLIYPPIKNQK